MDCKFLGELSECEKVVDDYLELKFTSDEKLRKTIMEIALSQDIEKRLGEIQLVEGIVIDDKVLLVREKASSDTNGLGKWWTDFQKNDDSLRGSLITRMNEKNDTDSSKIFGFYNELR